MQEDVKEKVNFNSLFQKIETADIWSELARRLNVRFGKIQMSIHEGKPSRYANVDIRINTEEALEVSSK